MLEKSIGPLTKAIPNHDGSFSMGILNRIYKKGNKFLVGEGEKKRKRKKLFICRRMPICLLSCLPGIYGLYK
jgi:hypothetical protein